MGFIWPAPLPFRRLAFKFLPWTVILRLFRRCRRSLPHALLLIYPRTLLYIRVLTWIQKGASKTHRSTSGIPINHSKASSSAVIQTIMVDSLRLIAYSLAQGVCNVVLIIDGKYTFLSTVNNEWSGQITGQEVVVTLSFLLFYIPLPEIVKLQCSMEKCCYRHLLHA